MFSFFKDSLNELSHVVWSTKKESRTYMQYVVGVIVIMTIILSIFGYIFRGALFQGRVMINGESAQNNIIGNHENPNGTFDVNMVNSGASVNTENQENISANSSTETSSEESSAQ